MLTLFIWLEERFEVSVNGKRRKKTVPVRGLSFFEH